VSTLPATGCAGQRRSAAPECAGRRWSIVSAVLILVLLIALNAVFSLSEISVFSARKSRLEQRARSGDVNSRVALELATSPDDFLSTVQVGMTLVGVLAGAFGEATIAEHLAGYLRGIPAVAHYAEAIATGVVVALITYFTLILGELVPKRLALLNPERFAAAMARPMRLVSRLALPLVRLLTGSTRLVVGLLGAKPSKEAPVTEEEIRMLIAQGTVAGTFEKAEQDLVERAFRLGDRPVATLMTPRPRLVWLDVADGEGAIARKIAASPFSRFPVGQGNLDNCLGYVQARDLLDARLAGRPINLRESLRQPLLVPEHTRALALLARFKSTGTHFAIVIDEYGGIEGIVTLNDILEALVGDMPSAGEGEEPPAMQRADGSWLVDGAMAIDDLRSLIELPRHPAEERAAFRTLAGFVMNQLGRVPRTGDHFEWGGKRFEVVDMDGHLVDKVLVAPVADIEEE
jgi:putative hemolysin